MAQIKDSDSTKEKTLGLAAPLNEARLEPRQHLCAHQTAIGFIGSLAEETVLCSRRY